jgi:hypothetical protein
MAEPKMVQTEQTFSEMAPGKSDDGTKRAMAVGTEPVDGCSLIGERVIRGERKTTVKI